MIVGNTCSEIGDVLLMESSIPITGLTSITSFIDVIIGETGTRFFLKEFSYSNDGLNFSNFIPLNNSNLSAITISSTDYFLINYRYTRAGTDSTGILEFDSVTLNGTFSTPISGTIFQSSIFAQFENLVDADVLKWCMNVTKKLYYKGVVPNYILRRINQNSSEDKDYIDFWRTVANYFAIVVIYGRRLIDEFKNYPNLLEDYLEQKGLFLNDNPQYQDMMYLMNKYFDEIRQRGTLQIIKEKQSTELPLTSIFHTKSNNGKSVNGELLRLICYKNLDEFIFNLIDKKYIGWNINNSSPLWQGLTNQNSVNKAYENSQDVLSLVNYPLFNSQYIKKEHDYWSDKHVMEIKNVPLSGTAGIGIDPNDFPHADFNKVIRVHEDVDYEITFWLKQPTFDDSDSDSTSDSWSLGGNQPAQIPVGCFAFDSDNNQTNLLSINTGLPCNYALSAIKLSKVDTYYFVRVIIYKKDEPLKSIIDSQTNLNVGVNLKFQTTIRKIIPFVFSISRFSSINSLYIWDFKVKPLKTPFSTGFVQTKNFIEIWMEQNNMSLTNEQVEEIMRRYLLPYNCNFKNIYLANNNQSSSSSGSY